MEAPDDLRSRAIRYRRIKAIAPETWLQEALEAEAVRLEQEADAAEGDSSDGGRWC